MKAKGINLTGRLGKVPGKGGASADRSDYNAGRLGLIPDEEAAQAPARPLGPSPAAGKPRRPGDVGLAALPPPEVRPGLELSLSQPRGAGAQPAASPRARPGLIGVAPAPPPVDKSPSPRPAPAVADLGPGAETRWRRQAPWRRKSFALAGAGTAVLALAAIAAFVAVKRAQPSGPAAAAAAPPVRPAGQEATAPKTAGRISPGALRPGTSSRRHPAADRTRSALAAISSQEAELLMRSRLAASQVMAALARWLDAVKPAQPVAAAAQSAGSDVSAAKAAPPEGVKPMPPHKVRAAPAGMVLNGIIKTPNGQFANVNGRSLAVGDRIGRSTVVAIGEFSVELERDGEYFVLGIGQAPAPPANNYEDELPPPPDDQSAPDEEDQDQPSAKDAPKAAGADEDAQINKSARDSYGNADASPGNSKEQTKENAGKGGRKSKKPADPAE